MSYQVPPPPPGYGGYGGAAAPRTDQKAVWALVLGILSILCCGFLAGIPALLLGSSSKRAIDASGGGLSGRGMAQAGVVLGIIGIVLSVVGLVYSLTTGGFDFSTNG